jgi:hypothetical protein
MVCLLGTMSLRWAYWITALFSYMKTGIDWVRTGLMVKFAKALCCQWNTCVQTRAHIHTFIYGTHVHRSHSLLKDGDMLWEMCQCVVLSLGKLHRVYLPILHGTACSSQAVWSSLSLPSHRAVCDTVTHTSGICDLWTFVDLNTEKEQSEQQAVGTPQPCYGLERPCPMCSHPGLKLC